MKYAIVDIETTGGYASGNGITEISIQIHDGSCVVDSWETLINPEQFIPSHIEALTGISNEMVQDAPNFDLVAPKIFSMLEDKIFVAHNVNFDYSFIRHHLSLCGHTLNAKKLCTVRLSRKLYPGLPSYSLGKLCRTLNINLNNRHRAGGDAEATAILFGMLLQADVGGIIEQSLGKSSKEQVLPAHLSRSYLDRIPSNPGVYYFKDEKGKVIYIGKAKNLMKRVNSHFTGNSSSKQRQDFLKKIHNIDYEVCGTELMALILEASEIKRLWPENNRALKRYEQKYSLFKYEDQKGYWRLAIDKYKGSSPALYSFNSILDGRNLLKSLVSKHVLCEKLCSIQTTPLACTGLSESTCYGACVGSESPETYNLRVEEAIDTLRSVLPSFAMIDAGRTSDEQSCLWVEEGKFIGMGYIPPTVDPENLQQFKSSLQLYPSNDYILNLISNYAEAYPEKKLNLYHSA
jgi:DNA polymerase-3 subunit epsilon